MLRGREIKYDDDDDEEEEEDEDEDEDNNEESDDDDEDNHRLDYLAEGFIQKMKCENCGLFIPENQPCYVCVCCSYAAHKACADLPTKISGHTLHKRHSGDQLRLTFIQPPPGERDKCYYCRETIRGGGADPYYACEFCAAYDTDASFIMHASCALIPLPTIDKDDVHAYVCHRRRMVLVHVHEVVGDDIRAMCFSCGTPWSGPAYRCAAAPRCNNFFHKPCAELPKSRSHWSHPRHGLELSIGRPEPCGAGCGRTGCRHTYRCFEDQTPCKSFAVGVECMFNGMRMRWNTTDHHGHGLVLVENRPGVFKCSAACGKSHDGSGAVEVRRTRNISFRCSICVFGLHFVCGPLPSVVKFDYHIHPLLLVDLLVEDESGEYYCDVCEEERDPRLRVYYCEPCKYTAHVHCLLSEIMKLMKEKSTTDDHVEFVMLGESPWIGKEANLGTNLLKTTGEMAVVKEPSFYSKVVGRLTEEERAKLNHIYNSDYSSTDHKITFNQGATSSLGTFLDGTKESKIKDVDSVERFFGLDSNDFTELYSKLSYSKREKFPLGLDYKYLRMKVVDVGGYTVPLALASDLKTLLHKHGDLGINRDSSLTPQMKSVIAALLCVIFHRMRNTMAEDISIDDLKRWCFDLNCVRKIAGYKITELDCFEESVFAAFLGFEASRLEKDANESIELKIAKLEAELENCKRKHDKLKQYESTASDFMKECLRKALGSKLKTVDKLF